MSTQTMQRPSQTKPGCIIPTFYLSDIDAIEQRSSTGWLLKWRIGVPNSDKHIWVKTPGYIMDWGGEPYAEVLASAVCKDFGLKNYTIYYPCIVDYKGIRLLSCYSYDFCEANNEKLITCLKILELSKAETRHVYIDKYKDILQIFKEFTGLNIQHHLEDMLFLDYMICNFDRGFHNFGFLINRQLHYREAPIFDNGNSFNLPFLRGGEYDRNFIHVNGDMALPFHDTFENQLKLIRGNRVYKADFKNTIRVLRWFMLNSSDDFNRIGVVNTIPMDCYEHITSMLSQNYTYYKQLFKV